MVVVGGYTTSKPQMETMNMKGESHGSNPTEEKRTEKQD